MKTVCRVWKFSDPPGSQGELREIEWVPSPPRPTFGPNTLSAMWDAYYGTSDRKEQFRIQDAPYERAETCGLGG